MVRKITLSLIAFLGLALGAFAQQRQVSGTVVDSAGAPIDGASVTVVDTNLGTITSDGGKFSFAVPTNGTMEVSFLGYKIQSQPIAGKRSFKFVLAEDAHMFEEVMVVAFGTAKKSQFTGSASTIDSDNIISRQTSNITNALSGQVAGLQVTSTNGEPGAKASVRIRGIGSMHASNEPLYVVDGVPFDGGIETISSQDIESMTVLKDAASNSLYGARGANGVILITTKQGKVGQDAQITFDAKWGTNRRGVQPYDVMTDPKMYYETYYQSFKGANPAFTSAELSAAVTDKLAYPIFSTPAGESLFTDEGKINPKSTVGSVYADNYFLKPDDWFNEIFDAGNLRQEYNLNVSGASEKMTYYLSAGYLNDSGIIPNSGFSRVSLRSNTTYQAKDWLKFGTNISYSNSVNNSPREQEGSSSGNIFYLANNIAPIYPLYVRDAKGNVMTDRYGYTTYDYGAGEYPGLGRPFMGNSNPASMIELDKRSYTYDVFGGRAFAEAYILDGLKATANFGVDIDNTRSKNLYNAYYGQYAGEVGGIIYVGATRSSSFNQQYLLNYSKDFELNTLEVMAGYESYNYQYEYLNGSKEKLYNPSISEIDNAIKNPSVNSYTDNYSTQGLLARVQYDYDDKYFASASYRRDASSRFHPDNRWGNFWSVGGGWLLNKESFLESADYIDILKFKASYGVQGNDNILDANGVSNYYPYLDQYAIKNSNNEFALAMSYKGNKDLTWETSHSFNTGFDFGFFDNRLSGTVEYFSRVTTDMLYYRPVAPSIGYSSVPTNIGSMVNRGFELELFGDIIRTNDVVWSVNLNATTYKNEILELAPELKGELISGSRIYTEGESMYNLYIREYAGVDHETGEALYYTDVEGADGKISRETTNDYNTASRYATGDILPKLYGGFGTSVEAYGFDFSVALSYQLGGRVLDYGYMYLMHAGSSGDVGQNWHMDILDAWTPDNKDSDIPRLNYNDDYTAYTSDRFFESSNYLSINNITLGYTLPKNIVSKIGLDNLRVYGTVDNLALWAARKGLDPRQGYVASDAMSYSSIRSISGGLVLSF